MLLCVPSQVPPQLVPSVEQALRGPTGLPVTGEQVPTFVETLHASHWPSQAESQQTPSVQKPVAH